MRDCGQFRTPSFVRREPLNSARFGRQLAQLAHTTTERSNTMDPRSLSRDQRELLDALEQLALLPDITTDEEIQQPVDRALDLLKDRVGRVTGRERLIDNDLLMYEFALRRDGFDLAADGVMRLLQRSSAEVSRRAMSQ